jgi:hypothetical protein
MASLQNQLVASVASPAELVALDACSQSPAHLLTLMLVALGSIFDILALILRLVLDLLCPL